jgi:branched-chain amino acid transport system substrate-binding protein
MVTLSSNAFGAEAVRIGVITDMSGPYSDLVGPGFVTAVQMATEDFGGKVLDRPIEVLAADANKARYRSDEGARVVRSERCSGSV